MKKLTLKSLKSVLTYGEHCNPVALVLLLSGVAGFLLGVIEYPTWQAAVEPAQVISGIVQYPKENPTYMYQKKIWTILHQAGALFLYLGGSERTLSVFISGLAGMVSFQALSLWVLAISSDYLLAIASPFFILLMGNVFSGITYPIMLMGTYHTYGMLGLSFILLVAALIGVGQYKWGGLLLGMAPAVHPSLGVPFGLVVIVCLLWDFRRIGGGSLREVIRYAFFGGIVSAASLILHLLMVDRAISIGPDTATSDYFYAFVRYWDIHRRPFPLYSSRVSMIIMGMVICVLWLSLFKEDVPRHARFLFHTFIVSALLGGVSSIMYWLPPEQFPAMLLALMPGRLLSVNVISFIVLLLGLLGYYKREFWIQFNLSSLALMVLIMQDLSHRLFILSGVFLVLVVAYRKQRQMFVFTFAGLCSIVWGLGELRIKSDNPVFFGRYSLEKLLAGLSLLASGISVLFAVSVLGSQRLSVKLADWFSIINPKILSKKEVWGNNLRAATLFVFGLIAIATVTKAHFQAEKHIGESFQGGFHDWTNDPLFGEAAKGKGMLLTCSDMQLIQLRSRRPILLDGSSLDGLPYVFEAGPNMNQILRQVYGVDLLNPPEEIKKARPGALLRETGRILWEARTAKQWEEIAKQYGVTNVLCYANWKLQLPEVIHNDQYALYKIR